MVKFLKENIFVGLIFIIVLIFFYKTLFLGFLPIPGDTIPGLYYPFRDNYSKNYPNGIPFKNFLVTDPVRQQYPWKNLTIELESKRQLPLWNPYEMAGMPLLANFQSGSFYTLNILFFIKPFFVAWSLFIILSPLLSSIFLYFFLDNLKLDRKASFLGAIIFAFCGFSIAWLEWGNVLHTALYLPLLLLATDKMMNFEGSRIKLRHFIWSIVFGTALQSSFSAGHLQTFFYVLIFSIFYFLFRWFQKEKDRKHLFLFILSIMLFFGGTLLQSIPTFQLINLSARSIDLNFLMQGWFIPWQNLIQFFAPDFFGNPATLNYFGVWNYAEFIGYIGIFPLIMALFAIFARRDRKTLFFTTAFIASLIFALPTIFAKVPFKLELPFISTAQPTRLIFIADFSLSVLSALGLDLLIKKKSKIFYPLGFIGFIFLSLWIFVISSISKNPDFLVSKQNLIFPSIIFLISLVLISLSFLKSKNSLLSRVVIYVLILLTIFDLFRFGWKFEPFTDKKYLFPSNSIISFLQKQTGVFRIMSTDSRILPPNFSIMYKLQSVDGYDPLYLLRYGELMAASGREKSDISPPFGFNRIITPQNFQFRITDLLGVKYVLSFEEIDNPNFKKVFSDGKILVYENTEVLARAFFVNNTLIVNSKQDAINSLFDVNYSLKERAVVENSVNKNLFQSEWSLGKANLEAYEENKVIIKTENAGNGFLVLTDSFYPSWHAKIDGKENKIYLTDFNFRGLIVPKGVHTIEFYNTLF